MKIENKVIALTNSLITKDVPDNTIIGGNPAKPIKIDGDFRAYQDLSEIEKYQMMKEFAKLFSENNNIKFTFDDKLKIIQLGNEEIKIHCNKEYEIDGNDSATIFNIIKRTYRKKHNPMEKQFMKFLLSYKARFTPE